MSEHQAGRFRRHVGRDVAAGACALLAFVGAAEAGAVDFQISADTAAQAYEVAGPWGDVVLERRRLMQTLGLGVYNLQGPYEPGKPDYSIVVRLRLDADFGVNGHPYGPEAGGETTYSTPAGDGIRFVPGVEEAPFDLMYAYAEGRNLAGGWMGFRVGRQYQTDVLGWWSFDGGLVRVTTPYYVQAEIYGGVEQRGGLVLSSSRFERGGIWRGSHAAFGDKPGEPRVIDYPSYQYTQPAPAFGFAVESAGPSWVHGRFSYRRVYNLGTSITQQFPAGGGYRSIKGMRLSQERLGYAANIEKADLGGLKGGFTYDLYSQIVGSYFAGLEAHLGKRVTLGADVDYFVPTFDADSIWNWFTRSPITTITARAAVDVTPRFDVAMSGGVRLWTADGDPETYAKEQCLAYGLPENCFGTAFIDPSIPTTNNFSRTEENRGLTTTLDVLGNVSGRYRWASGDASLRGMVQAGERGRRVGGDVAGEQRLAGGRFAVAARASVYDWADPLRPDRDATSFGYVVGGGYTPAKLASIRMEWEHDMNRLVGHRFRIVGLLNLRVDL